MTNIIDYQSIPPKQFINKLYYDTLETAVGHCYIARTSDDHIVFIGFTTPQYDALTISQYYFKNAKFVHKSLDINALKNSSVTLYGTPFQLQVWQYLTTIKSNHTISYQEVAQQLGKPTAARAVGQAIGQNPVCILIPCHRVIYKSGQTGHYAWGATIKRQLLSLEAQGKGWLIQ